MKDDKKKVKLTDYDIGLAFLRPFLAFAVIMKHCYNPRKDFRKWTNFYLRADCFLFHVPIFMIMALYFSQKTIISNNYKKKFERLKRLFIPYFFWPFIIVNLDNILKLSINIYINISFKDLKQQYLYGFGLLGHFWYQWDLIFITIIYYFLSLLFKAHLNFILILISITSFIYQYNGENYKFLSKFRNYDGRKVTLGRFLEMIPFSVVGFVIASNNILQLLRKYKIKVFLVCIYIAYFLYYYNIFSTIKGSCYHGIKLYLISICLFISFSMFPSEIIKNKIIIKLIKQITNYTAGIYYLHVPIFLFIQKISLQFRNKKFECCIILYLICYLIY